MLKDERETIITLCDGDPHVRIWSAQKRVITALRKKPETTEVSSTMVDGTECVEFTIPADRYDPARGIRTVLHLTDEQRQQRTARLRTRTRTRTRNAA